MSQASLDIAKIIERRLLVTHFQPIVSVTTGHTVGLEALTRGGPVGSADLVPPGALFAEAERTGCSLELDRAARKGALHTYGRLKLPQPLLLFVNINVSILNERTIGSNNFLQSIVSEDVDPSQVAIEVVESMIENPRHLVEFTERYRERGTLIVIDDFGAKHSNLTRLNDIRPDIVKIDRAIISGLDRDPYKRSIVSSICDLTHNIGALCLAEGIETEEELTACHRLNVDLYQGFYFSAPDADVPQLLRRTAERIERSRRVLENTALRDLEGNRAAHQKLRALMKGLCTAIAGVGVEVSRMERILADFLRANGAAACCYLLDGAGRQISDTLWREDLPRRRLAQLFHPTPRGFDHSLKSYVVNLRAKDEYFSDSYISLATGNPCRTMSMRLRSPSGAERIVCVDFEQERMSGVPEIVGS